MGLLTRNFRAKLLAIVIAVALWTVVAYSETEARAFNLTVEQVGAPPAGLVVVGDIPQVRVEVVAPGDALKTFDPKTGLRATANFRELRKGTNQVPVQLELQPNVTVRRLTPTSIRVDVDELDKVSKQVKIERTHQVPSGFREVSATAKPQEVTIEGPKSQLDGVEAVATIDLDGKQRTFEEPSVAVVVRDAGKKKLDKLKVTPAEVSVTVTIQGVSTAAVKNVTYNLSGQPAAGYRVTSVTVTPPTVSVSGLPSALSTLAQVIADPVDISSATADVIRTVFLRPPAGVDANPKTVQVHVFIARTPPVTPPPSPPPTPCPSPATPPPSPCP